MVTIATAPTREITATESWFSRWWFAIGGLLFIIASDYKFRTRDPSEAAAASIDSAIILELGLYGLVGAAVVFMAGRPPRVQRVRPQIYLACFFVGLVLLSVPYADSPQYALVRGGQTAIVLAFVLLATRYATRAHVHRFCHGYLVLVAASVAYGVVRPSTPINRLQEGRFTWLAIHPTTSGLIAGVATVVATGYMVGTSSHPGPRWPRWAYTLLFAVAAGATFSSHTRGAVLGTIAGIFVLLTTMFTGPTRARVLAGMAAIAAMIFITATGPIIEFFVRDEGTENIATLNSRTELWSVALDAVASEPMFGFGVGSARSIFYESTGLGGGHNAAVNLLVELGVVGLVCWALWIISIAVGAYRLRRRGGGMELDRAMILAVLSFLMVDGVFVEGPGAVANVGMTWLFVVVAWLTVAQDSRA